MRRQIQQADKTIIIFSKTHKLSSPKDKPINLDKAREVSRLKRAGNMPAFVAATADKAFIADHYRASAPMAGIQVCSLTPSASTPDKPEYKLSASDLGLEGHTNEAEILELINGGNEFEHDGYMAGIYSLHKNTVLNAELSSYNADGEQTVDEGGITGSLSFQADEVEPVVEITSQLEDNAIYNTDNLVRWKEEYIKPNKSYIAKRLEKAIIARKALYMRDKKALKKGRNAYAYLMNKLKPEAIDKHEYLPSLDMLFSHGSSLDDGRSILMPECNTRQAIGEPVPMSKTSLMYRDIERHLYSLSVAPIQHLDEVYKGSCYNRIWEAPQSDNRPDKPHLNMCMTEAEVNIEKARHIKEDRLRVANMLPYRVK